MANHALAVLESALRARKLDRTLTTALPPLERRDESALVPTAVAALDACLHGGLPRGQLSEMAGPRSSGRTTLLLQMIAAATRRGEIAALIDTFDRLDVASASAAGIDLDRLLWIRGVGHLQSSNCNLNIANVDRALKALNLVLQAGGFAYVAIDLADVPPAALDRIPFTTWLRVQRIIEGSDTACVLVAPRPLARSAGGLTLTLTASSRWTGAADRSRHLTGADLTVRVVSPRRRVDGEVSLNAQCSMLKAQ
jgi:recombination protein RecA